MKKLLALAFLAGVTSATAQTGNVGIGTTTPTEKLDLNGNLKISGNLNFNGMTGLPGQVLTSQGINPPTWMTPGALPEGSGTNQYAQSSSELFTGDIILKSSAVADKWYDGVGLVSFGDTLFVFGGWYTSPSTGTYVTNQIRYSIDDGATWVVSSSVLPFSGHSFVYFKSPDGWFYMIGGDNYNIEHLQTVWRTKDFQNFTVMTTTAGWGNRTLMGGFVDESGVLYIAGGQVSTTVQSGPNDIWRSSDGGATWTQVANNIQVNGEFFLGQNISNQVKYYNKRVYVIGGGISAAAPFDTYSKKVYSASINNLSSWRREEDLPYSTGRRYLSAEIWDGKLWVWSGHNASEGNTRTLCYMDNTGKWYDFKYTYIGNNPNTQITTTHAAGITVHKDMLYRVLGNLNNDAYALKRSSYLSTLNIRDTINTKNIYASSMEGTDTRITVASPSGELKASTVLLSDILTTGFNFATKSISNQSVTAQAANLWITGRGLFGGGTDAGKMLQVNGEAYVSGTVGIGTSSPATYLAGVMGLSVYNPSAAGISIANSSKHWVTWIHNNDLKFYEGGPGVNRLTLKEGGVINVENLAGVGTRLVVTDSSGNLSSMIVPAQPNNYTASNLGNSTFGIYKQMNGTDLQFRSLGTQVDKGIDLVSNNNEIEIRNNSYAAYGKVAVVTGDATANVIIKTITPADNSAGTLEVDMAAVSSTLQTITGKKFISYKKSGDVITVGNLTEIVSQADGILTGTGWSITGASGDLQIKVTGLAATTIKWQPIFKLNEIIVP